MPVFYKLRQNTIKDSKVNGKWFAHATTLGTVSYKKLCEHIADHGSIYTKDVCVGVGMRLLDCILEKVMEGYRVEFGDFGAFRARMYTKGTDTVSEFSIGEHLKNVRLIFEAKRGKESETISTAMTRKAIFRNASEIASKPEMDQREQEQQEHEGDEP